MLIELTRRASDAGSTSVRASSRELAKRCKLARSNVVIALDSLAARNVIAARQGTATAPGSYRLNFLETVRMGGPVTGPPPAAAPPYGWSRNETTPVLFQDQGGPETGPPPTETTALTAAAAAVSISTASLELIDRVYSAKAKNLDPALLATFRRWLHGYMAKLGRDERNQPLRDPHPPPDDLVAQFLSIAEPRRLGTLLDSLMCDRQTCQKYGWFVIVALQRIHGLHFQEQQKARAALRVVRAGGRPIAEPPTPDAGEQLDFHEQIRAIARQKAIR